eukprot:g28143.t1
MLNGKNATIPPAWPGMCGQNVIVSLDKRMKKLCVRSSDPTADVSVQLAVPLTSIASIAFGCCSPGEGRLMATELSVTIFLDEGYGPSIVLEFIDLEERPESPALSEFFGVQSPFLRKISQLEGSCGGA